MTAKKIITKTKKTIAKVSKKKAAQRIKDIWPILKKIYPNAQIALKFSTPEELMVATILSAQCTDVRVNIVTETLFKKYRSVKDFADADLKILQQDVKTTGFYRNKAKNIKAACQMLISDFNSQVPPVMEKMLRLPGVGRKTANVLLGDAFSIPGITCDTHVIRLSKRLELSANQDPVKLEFDLAEIIPRKNWTIFSHLIILHGRNICKAPKPNCQDCQIAGFCPAKRKGN